MTRGRGARGEGPGKKVGATSLRIQRADPRAGHTSLTIEIRLDLDRGTFHARHEGQWYEAKTRDALIEQIRAAAQRTIDVGWQRYLIVDYEADARPLEGDSGRPRDSGSYENLSINDDRACLEADPDANAWDKRAHRRVVTSVGLTWRLCEFSTPYPRAGDGRSVRMRREIESVPVPTADRQVGGDGDGEAGEAGEGSATHEEFVNDPREQEDDRLPIGAVPWSPTREQVLRDVIAALGALDARMVELFRGDADTVARRIDDVAARGQPLLAAPATILDPTAAELLTPTAAVGRDEPIRLAFFVEDDADKAFVETLVLRLFPDADRDAPRLFLHVTPLGRRDALDRARDEVAWFSNAGYDGIFLIADANTTSNDEIRAQQVALQRRVAEGIQRVHVFLAISAMECWLLSQYQSGPERARHPLRSLMRHAEGRSVTDLVASLSIEQARQRSPSLDALLARVESVVEEAHERRRAPPPSPPPTRCSS